MPSLPYWLVETHRARAVNQPFLYVASLPGKPVSKVGISNDPELRVAQISCKPGMWDLELDRSFRLGSRAFDLEQAIHDEVQRQRLCLSGEWCHVPGSMMVSVIAGLLRGAPEDLMAQEKWATLDPSERKSLNRILHPYIDQALAACQQAFSRLSAEYTPPDLPQPEAPPDFSPILQDILAAMKAMNDRHMARQSLPPTITRAKALARRR